MGVLDFPPVRRTRRNHAVEHATIHLLAARARGTALAGRSDSRGFWLYGAVDTALVRGAVAEALARLETEPELALHPHCGTNLVVGALAAGLVSLGWWGAIPVRRRPIRSLDVLPILLSAGTLATLASQTLGPWTQARVTTLADARGVRVGAIRRRERGRWIAHRVDLVDGPAPGAPAD